MLSWVEHEKLFITERPGHSWLLYLHDLGLSGLFINILDCIMKEEYVTTDTDN